ncbi:hypothetical protein T10_9780 [Trichinella papuae]|uniref:Uncharacterized protein n=1 Tax=Trichinella papuae TaxID=268474 RepID=A0A0V1M2R1_9BILA|nr:hypothetical protein T10_9780 [Trichinella papuae]
MDERKETTDDKTATALHQQQQQQRQHSFPCTVPNRENQRQRMVHCHMLSQFVKAFKHPFAAKHHCQMKRHAKCWRATTKDDNLTALDQENMICTAYKSTPVLHRAVIEVSSDCRLKGQHSQKCSPTYFSITPKRRSLSCVDETLHHIEVLGAC